MNMDKKDLDLGLLIAIVSLEDDLIDIEKNGKFSADEFERSIIIGGTVDRLKQIVMKDQMIVDDGKRHFIISRHHVRKGKEYAKQLQHFEGICEHGHR